MVSKRNGDTSQNGSTIKFTIWDEMLDKIPIDLSHLPLTPVISIVTSTIVDMFKGVCYLKPTCATKMYYNLEIQEVEILLKSETILKDASIQLTGNATKGTENLSDMMFENRKELIDIFTIMEEPQTRGSSQITDGTIYHVANVLRKLFVPTMNTVAIPVKLKQRTRSQGTATITIFERESKTLISQSVQELIDLDHELEPADPDFYKIGYVRSVRAYGDDFKEGPDGFGVYASKDIEPLRRARVIPCKRLHPYITR
ncbi:hypothetical protein GIB67_018282 [Kingdonia uniflora]|uniref:Uncharacterized protein n=1 Tax=Kingdonia uniflora TaxID=39325 RepID=A0A7J7LF50_9MAGN|nr:hypothetical protein GIB67_018282 [Kingdonia uniflora]